MEPGQQQKEKKLFKIPRIIPKCYSYENEKYTAMVPPSFIQSYLKAEKQKGQMEKKHQKGNMNNIVVGRKFSTYQNALMLNRYKYQSTKQQGLGKNMIYLHGLLGSAKNWRSIALSKDVNNHNFSHSCRLQAKEIVIFQTRETTDNLLTHKLQITEQEVLSISMLFEQAMAEDVLSFADNQKIQKFTLLGHSMGGKVAMNVAQIDGNRLDGLIVVDAPPCDIYQQSKFHTGTVQIIRKLSSVDMNAHTKKSILKQLQEYFPDNKGMVNFLAQNIIYRSDGIHVDWICNMQGFNKNIRTLMGFEIYKQYEGELLLLLGQKSYRFQEQVYRKLFPHLDKKHICVVEGAGHWVHADKPKTTVAQISKFLEYLDSKQ